MSRERPIPFSAPMVKALLAGTKTQTRRVVGSEYNITGPNPPALFDVYRTSGAGKGWCGAFRLDGRGSGAHVGPYGGPGDRLWVKEGVSLFGDPGPSEAATSFYDADMTPTTLDRWPWKVRRLPSMFCPRLLSRIILEITDVRVERLQEISEEDAKAEGLIFDGTYWLGGVHPIKKTLQCWPDPVRAYQALWESINAKRAPWASNPWVWVLTFRRLA